MKYKWHARTDLPGSAAHLVAEDFARALCGMLKPPGATWNNEEMLLVCRKRCKSCERRLKLAKYWLTELTK
jgi:hypothetical protein